VAVVVALDLLDHVDGETARLGELLSTPSATLAELREPGTERPACDPIVVDALEQRAQWQSERARELSQRVEVHRTSLATLDLLDH
jgi:hypothetical protein